MKHIPLALKRFLKHSVVYIVIGAFMAWAIYCTIEFDTHQIILNNLMSKNAISFQLIDASPQDVKILFEELPDGHILWVKTDAKSHEFYATQGVHLSLLDNALIVDKKVNVKPLVAVDIITKERISSIPTNAIFCVDGNAVKKYVDKIFELTEGKIQVLQSSFLPQQNWLNIFYMFFLIVAIAIYEFLNCRNLRSYFHICRFLSLPKRRVIFEQNLQHLPFAIILYMCAILFALFGRPITFFSYQMYNTFLLYLLVVPLDMIYFCVFLYFVVQKEWAGVYDFSEV